MSIDSVFVVHQNKCWIYLPDSRERALKLITREKPVIENKHTILFNSDVFSFAPAITQKQKDKYGMTSRKEPNIPCEIMLTMMCIRINVFFFMMTAGT